MRKYSLLVVILMMISSVYAIETKLVVRAKAKDAKFIGTSIGGAHIIIRDGDSGEILRQGYTTGSTGNTKKIMAESTPRGQMLSDENAAAFETTIDLEEPKLLTIEAHAPVAQRQSMVTAATQIWLIPGKDVTGDGVILEIPGFALDILQPQAHQRLAMSEGKAAIQIRLNMVLM